MTIKTLAKEQAGFANVTEGLGDDVTMSKYRHGVVTSTASQLDRKVRDPTPAFLICPVCPSLGKDPMRCRKNWISGSAALLHHFVCDPKSEHAPERERWVASAETIVLHNLR
ncbi:MAG TPA: hypothetical protein VNW54_04380 [Granulicella sp.]|nr:hypothetical protein [Granulicella sp.]